MPGGTSTPRIILSAPSLDELLTTTEFLTSAAIGGQRTMQDLIAQRGELDRLQADLDQVAVELEEKRQEADAQIGRASCRERVELSVDDGGVAEKEATQ